MDFIQGDAVFLGTCTNLSESGLRGTFCEEIAPGSEGLLTLYHEGQQFQMRAKVYSVRFNFASDKERATKERAAMLDFIKLFAVSSGR